MTGIAAAVALAAAFCVGGQAMAGAVYIKRTEVTALITKGEGHRAVLNVGYNRLGEQHALGCVSDDGCVASVSAMVGISRVSGAWKICTLVDGIPTAPSCPWDETAPNAVGSSLASFFLTSGHHTVETGVYIKDATDARLGNWEAQYTVYVN